MSYYMLYGPLATPPVLSRIGWNIKMEGLGLETYDKYAEWRWTLANVMDKYCRNGDREYLEAARNVATALLKDSRSERILLYLPFSLMRRAPEDFKNAYLEAWYRLLRVQDVRENFYEGDVFELDARPKSGLEYVVKAAHLMPWLLLNDFIDEREWVEILSANRKNTVLLQSFRDAFAVLLQNGFANPAYMGKICSYLERLPEREKIEPTYVSERRQKWLSELDKPFEKLLTPGVWLGDPFQDKALIDFLHPKLMEIRDKLPPDEIALVGGSQAKGYGVEGSDLDVWYYSELAKEKWSRPGNPEAAHIYLNSFWVAGKEVSQHDFDYMNATRCRRRKNKPKYTEDERRTVEKLEYNLCLYRLLHKGFGRFVGKHSSDFLESSFGGIAIDGDCPFYDEKYRRVATALYARYVWL